MSSGANSSKPWLTADQSWRSLSGLVAVDALLDYGWDVRCWGNTMRVAPSPGTVGNVTGFGCRPITDRDPTRDRAGVRKPPGKEGAGDRVAGCGRALWGFGDPGPDGLGPESPKAALRVMRSVRIAPPSTSDTAE